MKVINKTESVAEFVARGGNVTKYPTKAPKKKYSTPRIRKEEVEMTEIDWSVLPDALKISYGIK